MTWSQIVPITWLYFQDNQVKGGRSMTGGRLLTKLLKFKGLRLVGWWFEGRSNFIIVVKPYKNGSRCPSCDRRGKVIRTMPARRWRDLPIREWSVFLQYAPREIRCPTTRSSCGEDTVGRAIFSCDLSFRVCPAQVLPGHDSASCGRAAGHP